MRKIIQLHIREINVDDDGTRKEAKHFTNDTVVTEDIDLDSYLPIILDNKWPELRNYFLENRKDVSFRPIRRDYEETSKD